jgi:hypothetical protein
MRYLLVFILTAVTSSQLSARPDQRWHAVRSNDFQIRDHRAFRQHRWTNNRAWLDQRRHFSYRSDKRRDHAHGHQQDNHSPQWYTAGKFRSHSNHDSEPVIEIHNLANTISLQSTKRSILVDSAYMEFSDGRTVRIREFEGHIHDGERRSLRLYKPRHIKRVHLHLSHTGRKGYASLSYAN